MPDALMIFRGKFHIHPWRKCAISSLPAVTSKKGKNAVMKGVWNTDSCPGSDLLKKSQHHDDFSMAPIQSCHVHSIRQS
jgi:hypothetical protein